jgi:glycosyltransferase involved in cell wall biosynthesis
LPNVELHGPIPYAELGKAYAQIDVLLIPFRQTELGATINPIKLYEGLATGRPMVVPRLPNLEALGAPLRFYRGPEELVDILRGLRELHVISVDQQAVAFARANSWTARAGTVLETLSQLQ